MKSIKKIFTKSNTPKSSKSIKIDEETIRRRAYEIYLETGSLDEKENWRLAEKDLKAKIKARNNN